MSKPLYRSILHDLVPRTLAVLRETVAELPRPGAIGPQVLRALLVLTAAPVGCVAQPMPVTARVVARARPAAVTVAQPNALRQMRRGDRA